MERMQNRDDVTDKLPHGTLWSQGLKLAEAEIGRGRPDQASSGTPTRLMYRMPWESGMPSSSLA